jgi:hypothetical protein
MPLREYKDLEEEERVWNFSKTDRVVRTEEVPEEMRTTVMMVGIPNEYTRDDILHLLQEHDFGEINFLYFLMNLNTGLSAGYCFINFRFPEDAQEFKTWFTGFVFDEKKPEEKGYAHWRNPIQGFASHFDRYQNSSLTWDKVPLNFGPMLFRERKPMFFPKPWAQVKNTCRKFKKRTTSRRK